MKLVKSTPTVYIPQDSGFGDSEAILHTSNYLGNRLNFLETNVIVQILGDNTTNIITQKI